MLLQVLLHACRMFDEGLCGCKCDRVWVFDSSEQLLFAKKSMVEMVYDNDGASQKKDFEFCVGYHLSVRKQDTYKILKGCSSVIIIEDPPREWLDSM